MEENEKIENNEELTSEDKIESSFNEEILKAAIAKKDRKVLNEIFEKIPDADIARACEELEITDVIQLFRYTDSSQNAPLFSEFSQELKEALIEGMTNKDLIALIRNQSADDVTDALGSMPANLSKKVLLAADPDLKEDVKQLLGYDSDSAGAIMTTEYLEFKESESVKDVIAKIREKGKEAETIYTIFVRDLKRKFVGTVDLDDLIWAKEDQILSDIMNRDAPFCHTKTDKEDVANMFRKYDLNAMAVLNGDDCLVGIVTVDDAVDVLTEERNEDLALLTKMQASERPYNETGVWKSAKNCIPWLIVLIVLGTFTTMVLNRLEMQTIFTSLPILISFVPTLMDTGGNAGGQTTGLMIRALGTDELSTKDTKRVLWKEFRSGVIVAAFVGLFALVWIFIEIYTGIVSLGTLTDTDGTTYNFEGLMIWNGSAFTSEYALAFASHAITFSALVGVTMFLAITVSKMVGTLLCMGASALKKDPALLAQPLLTTVMDVMTLIIYFLMACLFFPAFA